MNKYYIIDRIRKQVYDFDNLDDYLEAEKKFMLDCFYNHIRWNWYNCTKVMVILDE